MLKRLAENTAYGALTAASVLLLTTIDDLNKQAKAPVAPSLSQYITAKREAQKLTVLELVGKSAMAPDKETSWAFIKDAKKESDRLEKLRGAIEAFHKPIKGTQLPSQASKP